MNKELKFLLLTIASKNKEVKILVEDILEESIRYKIKDEVLINLINNIIQSLEKEEQYELCAALQRIQNQLIK